MSILRMPKAIGGVLGVAAVAMTGFSTPAQSTETINLTAIDGYPSKALWVKVFIDYYIPEIDKRLAKTGNYKIKWNQAWGGQIVKPRHVLEGLQKGLGDIGVVTTVFHGDKVPLQMIAYATPFVTTNPVLVSRTVDGLADKFPAFRGAWKTYNQVYLTNLAVLDSYQMISKTPMATLADFNGLKVGSAGMNLLYLKGFGAAGVGGSMVSYYNKLKTGVLDAVMLWAEGGNTFKLYEVAPYMLKADIGSVNSKAITFNADRWAKLPGEVKTVISEAAIAYREHMTKTAVDIATSSYALFEAKGGKITTMTGEERAKWIRVMPNVAKSWAEGLEKKGVPGKAVLKSYMDTMRANKQHIVRHWDQE